MQHYDGSILSRHALGPNELKFVRDAVESTRELIRFWKQKHRASLPENRFRIFAERRDAITAMTAADTRIQGLMAHVDWVSPGSNNKRISIGTFRADEILELCALILKEHDRHCGALMRNPKVLVARTRESIDIARAAIKLVSCVQS